MANSVAVVALLSLLLLATLSGGQMAFSKRIQPSSSANADLVVAQDGLGSYRTISEAVTASVSQRGGRTTRFVIYVKAGMYNEYVQITASMANLTLIGDGIGRTVVTGNRSVNVGYLTYYSTTVAVTGFDFTAQDMTFENTAGPQMGQAVALMSESERSVLYRCSFRGYQDTLYAKDRHQFYHNCGIYGTVDFIFGDATVLFQGCNLYLRKPLTGQRNAITAQGGLDSNKNSGISIHNCSVAAAESLGSTQSYLGRPWKPYTRTIFIKSSIGSEINSTGWLEWPGNTGFDTLYYGEYQNTGAGAGTGGRVKWPGFHIMTIADASNFTVENFLGGGSWIAAAGVPYTPGL